MGNCYCHEINDIYGSCLVKICTVAFGAASFSRKPFARRTIGRRSTTETSSEGVMAVSAKHRVGKTSVGKIVIDWKTRNFKTFLCRQWTQNGFFKLNCTWLLRSSSQTSNAGYEVGLLRWNNWTRFRSKFYWWLFNAIHTHFVLQLRQTEVEVLFIFVQWNSTY